MIYNISPYWISQNFTQSYYTVVITPQKKDGLSFGNKCSFWGLGENRWQVVYF